MGNPFSTALKPENIERVLESKFCCCVLIHIIIAKASELMFVSCDEGNEHFSLPRYTFFVCVVFFKKIE